MKNEILYQNSYNPTVFSLIEDRESLLDIGCADGLLGKQLHARFPHMRIDGVEYSPHLAEKAKPFYSNVYVQDVMGFTSRSRYDIVVMGDILEHLVEPSMVLTNVKSYLNNDGFIIVSLPNVANWQVRYRLLCGNFDPDLGILCREHLHFYTRRTAANLLYAAGWRIAEMKTNNSRIKLLGRIWPELFAFQFVFKCTPLSH